MVPSTLALASVYTSTQVLALPLYVLGMGADTTQCLSSSNIAWHKSIYTNDSFLCVNLCNGSAIALKLHINLQKNCTKPSNNCIYLTVVDTGYLFKLHTFKSLLYILSGMILKLRNVVLLCKKLHFLSLQ